MAENNIADNQTNEKFQSVVKRKFERFRTKLAELFFATQPPVTNTANFNSLSIQKHNQQQHAHQQPDDNSSMLISNCYYGYTSPITEEDLRISCKKKSKRFNKNHHHTSSNSSASSSSACSSSSSIIIDDDEHSTFSNYTSQPQTGELFLSQIPVHCDSHASLPQSLTTGVITLNKRQTNQQAAPSTLDYYSFNSQLNLYQSNYDTSSLNTNEEENPFLNKRLTDQIHFNGDLTILSTYFESALDLIDDQDNFFNIDFMTNYIAYILLKQVHDSDLLKQIKWTLKLNTHQQDKNLLKEIAEQIFLESRDEPCGLKGCNILVFVQSEDTTSDESQPQKSNTLVSKFQFGTSRFGVFDLNLFLKHDQQVEATTQQSTIATLTRRIFNTTANKTPSAKQLPTDSKIIYLDSSSYDLFKTNLAYE